jgi:hypothetical protein
LGHGRRNKRRYLGRDHRGHVRGSNQLGDGGGPRQDRGRRRNQNDGARRAELVKDYIEPSLAERDVLNVRRQHRGEYQLIERGSATSRHVPSSVPGGGRSGRPSQNLQHTTWEPTLPLPGRDRSPGQTLGPPPARAPHGTPAVVAWVAGMTVPNMGTLMLQCEISGDASRCPDDPRRTRH